MTTKEQRHQYYITHRDKWLKNAIENKEANTEHKRLYALRNPEKVIASKVKYTLEHLTERQEYGRKHYQANKEAKQKRRKELCDAERKRFLDLYGNACECCGETEPMFLVIDHIKGQKGISKKETGIKAYRKANAKVDKTTYRILCHNCNFATRFDGAICPHQIKK